MTKRVALYLRVSTDSQTVENQRLELQAVADRLGWIVVTTLADEGISGSKGRDQRPAFNRLMTMVTRREIDMVMAWSVDRLGRSLQHLVGFLSEINERNVDLYLHVQGLDTSTPSGRAMFAMLGVFAEFERSMLRDRIMAGLARSTKKSGRPSLDAHTEHRARKLLGEGNSINATAKTLRIGVATTHRIKTRMMAEAA
jgi:DNA invertase Pin-like site-specific DNA recombinase